jgi:hypothetical protein
MNKAVKEGYGGRRFTKGGSSFDGEFLFWGFSWICREESLSWGVEQRISTGSTGLLEVLGTGARISIWYPRARKLS